MIVNALSPVLCRSERKVGGNVIWGCLYQKSVCKEYQTCRQWSTTGFRMLDQRHFLSLYSYSLLCTLLSRVLTCLVCYSISCLFTSVLKNQFLVEIYQTNVVQYISVLGLTKNRRVKWGVQFTVYCIRCPMSLFIAQ